MTDSPNKSIRLKTPVAPIDADALGRAKAALAELSLAEKVSLLAGNGTMSIASHPGIGQAEEFWFSDGPHTVRPELDRQTFNSAGRDDDHSTVLPTLSALAATWDAALARRFGEILGCEARDRGKDVLLGPGINLLRTPLNGRNFEYMGEDPHLAGQLATQYVRGVQSQDVGACLKHLAGNEQELNRTTVDVHMDERTLRELYLAPFETAVVEGEVLTVMNGYNRFRGEYCSHNGYLNCQVLREEWGFPGFVVSDWGSLHETVAGALGGLDVEMHAGDAIKHFRQPLIDAVRNGRVPAEVVDAMARHVLYVMARIGKLGGRTRAPGARNTPEHQAFAREVASQAMVLLKNDNAVLPLDRSQVRRLLVIGSNADRKHTAGGWSAEGKPPYETTPLVGLREYLGSDTTIEFIPGPFAEIYSPLSESVIETIDTSDLEHGAAQKGWQVEYFSGPSPTGNPAATAFAREVDVSWEASSPVPTLLPGAFCVRWTTNITPPEDGEYSFSLTHDGTARLFIDGRKVIDANLDEGIGTSVEKAVLTTSQGHRLVVEFTPPANGGRLEFGWRQPSRVPTNPEELVTRCEGADAVLFITGNQLGHGRAHESEGDDRPSLALPQGDDKAISAVLSARPDTVIITQSGAPVAMPWVDEAPTILHYWFSGMDGGGALPQVVFGDVNPGGKLPFTMPRNLEDSPAHALGNYGPERVDYEEGVFMGYRWHDSRQIAPLFPFGHGLSYTRFTLDKPTLGATHIETGTTLTLQTTVKNLGSRAGAEVVQLYLGAVNPAVPRPERELKGFRKIFLEAGESRLVEFTLQPRDFAYWDTEASAWRVDAGSYTVQVGHSSHNLAEAVTIVLQ